ncbi:hypothetical protein AB6A40_001847 [Gnathostoma spinigerum]|uniref:phenylalanine--tRNA ligase n=1 Tax=Gnathostoma spinigerum TaxID=75299 RepID=A0ABD6E5A2_9BILA
MDNLFLISADQHLSQYSYINGYSPGTCDIDFLRKIAQLQYSEENFPNLDRWKRHISSFSEEELAHFASTTHSLLTNSTSLRSKPAGMGPSSITVQSTCNDLVASDRSESLDLPQIILDELKLKEFVETEALANSLKIDHQKIVGAAKSLLASEGLIVAEERRSSRLEFTDEGKEVMKSGAPEARVYEVIGPNGMLQSDVMKHPFGKIGIGKALAAQWISIDKSGGTIKVIRKVSSIKDAVQEQLDLIQNNKEKNVAPKVIQELKKRKLLQEINIKGYVLKKGPSFTTVIVKPEVDLTVEAITSGSWKQATYKAYNFNALGLPTNGGCLHPLMKVRSEFRQIFFQMGFSEMPTNRYVESSFWNFDALFQPQQHPARDAHDTFFISDPERSYSFPEDYLARVKEVHSKGGYGSKGYNYEWKIEEAQKNVLRTHTTAVSARQLYALAQSGFKPSKMFSIDRVFRNETLDATHLAEFHQVEGVIAERNLSLAHVMGLFTEFFRKCGQLCLFNRINFQVNAYK